MRRALALTVALLAFAPAAHAADVARAPLGWTINELVAGADGGAWVGDEPRRFRRRRPCRRGRRLPHRRRSTGRCWAARWGRTGRRGFTPGWTGSCASTARAHVTTLGPFEAADSPGFSLATGADGTVWAPTIVSFKLARVTPAGEATFTPLKALDCGNPFSLADVARASDGARVDRGVSVPTADPGRARRRRRRPSPTVSPARSTRRRPRGWVVVRRGQPALRRAHRRQRQDDLPGRRRRVRAGCGRRARRCGVVRARPLRARARHPDRRRDPARARARVRSSPSIRPAGCGCRAAVTSCTRRSTRSAPNGCDETPARLTAVTPRTISLAALRRDGLRVRVSEPAELQLDAHLRLGGSHQLFAAGKRIVERAGATIVYRPTERRLRRIARELAPATACGSAWASCRPTPRATTAPTCCPGASRVSGAHDLLRAGRPASSRRSLWTTCPKSFDAASSSLATCSRRSICSRSSVPRPINRVRSVSSDGGAMKMRTASGIEPATWRAPWTSISSTTDAPSAVRFSSSERNVP